jgi:hypothetical protein
MHPLSYLTKQVEEEVLHLYSMTGYPKRNEMDQVESINTARLSINRIGKYLFGISTLKL